MDDYEEEYDLVCPACGHSPVRYRKCHSCEDGWIWGYDEDPLWYDPDDYVPCPDCQGTGYHRWCPACGADLMAPEWKSAMDAQFVAIDELYSAVGE
jgi:hypothetical protein